MNRREVGVKGSIIIVSVPKYYVLYYASEQSFEGDVLVEQVLQRREVVWGFPWFDGDIGESDKTCIN